MKICPAACLVLLFSTATIITPACAMDNNVVNVLEKAMDVSASINFRSVGLRTFHTGSHSKEGMVCYQLLDKESGSAYRRLDILLEETADYSASDNIARSLIMNKDGIYAVSGGKAVKMASDLTWLPPADYDNIENASIAPIMHNGIRCRKITLILGTDHMFYSGGIGKIEIISGVDNNFIYAWTAYEHNGIALGTMDLGEVDFVFPLTISIFAIQNDLNIIQNSEMSELNANVFAELSRVEIPLASQDLLNELNAAIHKTSKTSFKSVVRSIDARETPRYSILYQLYDPADDFTFQRMDFVPIRFNEEFEDEKRINDSLISQSNRRNRSGYYNLLYDKAAIKNTFTKSIWYAWNISEVLPSPSAGDGFSITRKSIMYNGIPCREYTVSGGVSMAQERRILPAVRFVVMPDRNFVCLVEKFGTNGGLASQIPLGMPDFDVTLPVELFNIPERVEIMEAHNDDEYKEAMANIEERYYFEPQRERYAHEQRVMWIGGIWNWCKQVPNRIFIFIAELNPIYLLVPAAICIPVVIVIKRKGVNKSIKSGGRAGGSARRSVAKRR